MCEYARQTTVVTVLAKYNTLGSGSPTSFWSVPTPGSRRENPSNDPTNQEATSKSRDTPIHRF